MAQKGQFKDYSYLIGQKFRDLEVIALTDERNGEKAKITCLCKCGKTKNVQVDKLGKVRGCGCMMVGRFGEKNPFYKGGRRNNRLYHIWNNIKARISNPKLKAYPDYGGRGITMDKSWYDFDVFKEWAILNGYKDNLTIDRIENNGNYESSNCRWATAKQQSRNKRNNVLITHNGETKPLIEWCELYNLHYDRQRSMIYKHQKKYGILKLFL